MASGPIMFSTSGRKPVTRTGAFSSRSRLIAPITAAAPPMSLFMPFIPSAVLSEYPPVSKVTPLPTRATWPTGLPAGS